MNSLYRLTSNHFKRELLAFPNRGIIALIRPVTLKPVQPSPINKIENHDERNMKLCRPQSPHLSIYAPQMTSMLSINHRFTGMALAGYTFLLGFGAVVLPDTISHYIDALAHHSTLHFIGKLLIAFPLSYHFWNGIRHLFWDTGMFLTLREVYITGYAMLGLTIASTIILCLM